VAFFAELLKLVLVLILVLVAAVCVIRFGLVRLQPDYARPGSVLKIVERLPLSQRSWICLVQVAEKYLLLGVSATGITVLTEMGAGELPPPQAPPASREFKSILRGVKSFYNPTGGEADKK